MNLEKISLNDPIWKRVVETIYKPNEDPEVPKKEVKHPSKGKFIDRLG